MKRKIRVELFKGRTGRWYWRAKSSNGKILADSAQGNGYNAPSAALKSLQSLAEHIGVGAYQIIGNWPKKKVQSK